MQRGKISSRKRPENIVIIGGGIAGLALATKLGKKLGRKGIAKITLIDRNSAHVWKPMLHTFAAGTTHPYQQKIPFIAHAVRNNFHYIPGTLADIDRVNRVITLEQVVSGNGEVLLDERKLSYDTLILAAGSRANDFGIPGVTASCLFIDDLNEAESFNRRFYEELLRAVESNSSLDVAIVGGGATGVELAAEISQLLDIAQNFGSALRPALRLTLIESGSRILSAFPVNISIAAKLQLEKLGLTVLTDARVVCADKNGFSLADGKRVNASLCVWAAGVKAPATFKNFKGLSQTSSGQIVVRPTLQVVGDDDIFAIGDCSNFTCQSTEGVLPASAQVARQQAIHLAKFLPGWLEGQSIPPFLFHDFGAFVSLSGYNTYGTLAGKGLFRGGFIRGRSAQFSHAMLYRLHQVELHGFVRACLLWLSGAIASIVRPSIRMD